MKYNADTCTVELSVRSLCALAVRSGDIDFRHPKSTEALLLGGEIHRKLQAEARGYYSPEVTLTNTMLYGGLYYTVSGRADGIIKEPDGQCVDEIKCVHGYGFYSPPTEAHLAQLKCYAYFLAQRDSLDTVKARLTYYNVDSGKIKY